MTSAMFVFKSNYNKIHIYKKYNCGPFSAHIYINNIINSIYYYDNYDINHMAAIFIAENMIYNNDMKISNNMYAYEYINYIYEITTQNNKIFVKAIKITRNKDDNSYNKEKFFYGNLESFGLSTLNS